MSYGEARSFLAQHTDLIELSNGQGARVAICPALQGRVMTSSCDGLNGLSFGFINRDFIAAGKSDPHFNNYGAEDRMWLSPEGGPFSLWFENGKEQVLANWFTPPAFNEGAFKVISKKHDPFIRMTKAIKVKNTANTEFDITANRDVRLLHASDLAKLLGDKASGLIAGDGVKTVAYETINSITNRGADFQQDRGLVSIWMLSMLTSGPETIIVVPYKPGSEAELGPVVKSDYFGKIPADRLKILPQAILFRGDADFRSKIGTSQKRARNVLGSIDYVNNVVSIIQFTMPDDPTAVAYMSNGWGLPQPSPFNGDVANAYNDGPSEPGKKGFGDFYEIESLSPALALKTGQTLTHHHRTIHVQADPSVLAQLAKEVFGVDYDAVRKEMLGK
jgi:hypothetical protein